jgi:leader peptidase (prepilin peptidase)/N-methyltransferase
MARITLAERLADWRGRPLVALSIIIVMLAACAASVIAAPGLPGYFGAGLALIMIAIAAIDARFFIIPNELSASAFALALVNAAVLAPDMWGAVVLALLRAAVLGLLFYGLRALYRRVRGREGLGLGDVKLAAVAGAWLDWMTIPIAIQTAALAAISVFAVRYYTGGRTFDAAAKFPFGLFLAPSIWLAWLIDATLLTLGGL